MVTDEKVAKALELVAKGGGNYEYFFSKLTSPDWITPLQKKGRFSHPPEMVVGENTIHFPPWPEGDYLLRMAPLAPEAVFGAIEHVAYESNNELVHQLLLQIAAELPMNLAVQVTEKETKWASGQRRFFHMYEERIVPVILKLAAGGKGDVALKLLDAVLHIEAGPQEEPRVIDGCVLLGIGKPLIRIDSWDIQRVLTRVSHALVESVPEGFLEVVSDKLNTAVEIYVNKRGNGEDFSFIWRPRIDSGRFGDLNDTLVTGVRDVAVQIAQAGGYEIVSHVFRKYPWPIFRRLEYYAYSYADNLPPDFVNGLVSHYELYEDQRANPEFNDFLSKVASCLSETTKNHLLEVIDRGPDLNKHASYLDSLGDKREVVERAVRDEWRLGWFTVLKSIAGEERLKQLEELQTKYGPARPAYESGGVRAMGHISEITVEELKKFSIDELIAYLKQWEPPPRNQPEVPSRAGIGHQLQAWVSEDPALFSEHLKAFQSLELHPTYLRSVLDAFTGVLKSDRKFDPYKVAATIEWVLANTSKKGDEAYDWDQDPGWSWAHMSSARFLTELFLHEERLDTSRHEEFWPALKLIAENPSPTEQDEEKYREKADSAMLALNSTRPVGLEAVMRYLRWIKNSAENMKVDAENVTKVFNLLAAHLDPKVDSSVAVREMYGMQFALLCWLDQNWWEKQLPAMFPKDDKVLDRFAWNAYLRYSRPYAVMLPAMRFRYERAINALQANDTEVSDSDRNFGNHFMQYYAVSALQLEDPLLTAFFAKASPALRAQTLGDVGWHLGQEDAEDLDAAVQKRFMDLWERRSELGLEKINAFREEMGAFGWWFASKKFPDDWSISQLMTVLEKFRTIHHDFGVVKRLAELAPKYPYESVRALGIIFEEDKDGWAIHGWEDAPQIIVGEALKQDQKSREEADRVANVFVARGQRWFRDLLKTP
ncbi:MAG: hypothetical protein WCC87_27020 [Candidatus Korobacteraceae bacterium]